MTSITTIVSFITATAQNVATATATAASSGIVVDGTIHLSDIFTVGSVIAAMLWMFISFRDVLRDLVRDVRILKEEVREQGDRQDRHHEWLIRSGADRRVLGERRRENVSHDRHA